MRQKQSRRKKAQTSDVCAFDGTLCLGKANFSEVFTHSGALLGGVIPVYLFIGRNYPAIAPNKPCDR